MLFLSRRQANIFVSKIRHGHGWTNLATLARTRATQGAVIYTMRFRVSVNEVPICRDSPRSWEPLPPITSDTDRQPLTILRPNCSFHTCVLRLDLSMLHCLLFAMSQDSGYRKVWAGWAIGILPLMLNIWGRRKQGISPDLQP